MYVCMYVCIYIYMYIYIYISLSLYIYIGRERPGALPAVPHAPGAAPDADAALRRGPNDMNTHTIIT